jgi:hypothetical protein
MIVYPGDGTFKTYTIVFNLASETYTYTKVTTSTDGTTASTTGTWTPT